jgi:hypothetical protein
LAVSDVFTVEAFESDHSAGGISPKKEIAVASDGFNATLLTPFFLLYESALSFLFSFDHDCPLLVDSCLGANSVRHDESVQWRTEHDTAVTFSDHE